MNRFLEDVRLNLSDYLTLDYASNYSNDKLEIKQSKDSEISMEEYGKMLSRKGITITDCCKESKSISMLDNIVDILEKDYNIHPLIDSTLEGYYNIRIIYDKFYDYHKPLVVLN